MKAANSLGWSAVVLITFVSSFWAFWGVNEGFHEGWSQPTQFQRILESSAYLLPAGVLCLLSLISIRMPRVGGTPFILVGFTIAGLIIKDRAKFDLFLIAVLTVIPIFVGILFWFGKPTPVSRALGLSLGIPCFIALAFGLEPVVRVNSRFDDGDRGMRALEGNGVTLVWAPDGPGWTRNGKTNWNEASRRVRFLTDDGMTLADSLQDIWRLPTRAELVHSLTRNNHNAGGSFDTETRRAMYKHSPDKESPLWDPYAPLIYLWTSEEKDQNSAWIVVYHGEIFAKPKQLGSPNFGFRAVLAPN